jgi:hypothetical protein
LERCRNNVPRRTRHPYPIPTRSLNLRPNIRGFWSACGASSSNWPELLKREIGKGDRLTKRLQMDSSQILTIALAAVPNMLAVLAGILINNARLSDTNTRISELRAHMEARFNDVDHRFNEMRDLWRSDASSTSRNAADEQRPIRFGDRGGLSAEHCGCGCWDCDPHVKTR